MVDSWILAMTEYRPIVPQIWSWMDDIRFLQSNGHLGIGKYSVLKKIVRRCSKPLAEMVDRASKEIQAMQSGRNGK